MAKMEDMAVGVRGLRKGNIPEPATKKVQAATFLMIMAEDARKTYSTFHFRTDEEKSDVEVLKRKLAFYKRALSLAHHEARFGKRDQRDGETFNDWLIDLRVLAKSCEFGELEERMQRSCNILKIIDKNLQEKLVFESTSFTKTAEICRAPEHRREIQARPKSHYAAEMKALSEAQGRHCTKCSKAHKTDHMCPAKGRTCRKCGRKKSTHIRGFNDAERAKLWMLIGKNSESFVNLAQYIIEDVTNTVCRHLALSYHTRAHSERLRAIY